MATLSFIKSCTEILKNNKIETFLTKKSYELKRFVGEIGGLRKSNNEFQDN